ncbi:MAG: hypothetical protein VYE68_03405 [Acidobacteriota bacterium]|nr:hypothetical protein [Acidobacteriota bacterium]
MIARRSSARKRGVLVGGLLFLVTAVACSPSLDVQAALALTQVSSGWFDAGLDNLGRNKLVPTVSFRVENLTAATVRYLQLNAVFRRQSEEEEWGNAFVRVVGTEGLDAGHSTEVLRLESGRGYTGEQSRAEMLAHRDFVDVVMDLFVKHRGNQWVFLDSVDVERRLLTQ